MLHFLKTNELLKKKEKEKNMQKKSRTQEECSDKVQTFIK